jgi:hypothetical protein
MLCLCSGLAQAQTWPAYDDWVLLDTDAVGGTRILYFRNVKKVYYHSDSSYLYLRMQCKRTPNFRYWFYEGRYKWFIDLDGDGYYSNGEFKNAEYILFVEDTDPDDWTGDVYLLNDPDDNGVFDEWESDYSGGLVTDPSIADYRITEDYIDLRVAKSEVGGVESMWLAWATDYEHPNLDRSPNYDEPDCRCYRGPLVADSDNDGETDDVDNRFQ